MKRTKEEQAAITLKLQQENARIRALWAKQSIFPHPRYEIRRFDELNWGIIKDGDVRHANYYGKFMSALHAFPNKLWNDGDRSSVAEAVVILRRIEKTIDDMLPMLSTFNLEAPPSMLGDVKGGRGGA